MARDVETSSSTSTQPVTGAVPHNPYSGPPVLPARHPLNVAKRGGIIFGCLYMLHQLQVYHNVLRSPDVRHGWFQVGLATSIGILAIKTYVELYMGKLKKVRVDYESFPQSTHAVMLLLLMASLSFHIALWPIYRVKTILIVVGMVGFGVLLQFALLVPTYVQNAVGFVLFTFFLQEYSAVG